MESELEWLSGKLSFNSTSNTYLCTLNKSLNEAQLTFFEPQLLFLRPSLLSIRRFYQVILYYVPALQCYHFKMRN